jgi:hypothetical protein
MQCTLCLDHLTVSQTTAAGLKLHLLSKCEMVTSEIRREIEQAEASKINKGAAAAAAAAAAGSSTNRKRNSTGSAKQSSSSSRQMSIGHYAAGSRENALLPHEVQTANQHLLRALACGAIPFKVGTMPSVWILC